MTIMLSLILQSCSKNSETELPPVNEPMNIGRQFVHYPADSQQVKVNPPGFTWTAHDSAQAYRILLRQTKPRQASVVDSSSIGSTVFAPSQTLLPGTYNWTVCYLDSNGQAFGRSKTREFMVKENLPQLILPDTDSLATAVSGIRPRLFLTPAQKKRIMDAVQSGELEEWNYCLKLADAALEEPLYTEPGPYKDGAFEVNEWRRIYTPAKKGSAHAVRLALAWQLTGERKYLEGAKRWLLNLSSWDPKGITSHRYPQPDGTEGNTEAAMPMLERMGIAYDWVADELSESERATILGAIEARGNVLLDKYKKDDFLSNPWSNHDGRTLAFFGLASLATLGDLPVSSEWMDYILRSYMTSYPTWGSDDGGWSQGLSYWSAYVLWLTGFADALRQSTDIDIYNKPFFRNTGYFSLYCHPYYAKRGGFGDGGDVAPSFNEKLLVQKFALAFRDPYLLWQSNNIQKSGRAFANVESSTGEIGWREWTMEDVVSVLNVIPPGFDPEPPALLNDTRWLKDIGWVASHSALGDPENDTWLLLKSSRYGSFSHSHADQNSYQFNAFGEPLIIDSGYYPWYGSPHHIFWTRQTHAHNAILIDGRGQASGSMEAKGKIESVVEDGSLRIVTAECAQAYNATPREHVLNGWLENLGSAYPAMSPSAETVRRTVVFNSDKNKPWMLIHDYVETDGPATFDYLIHSLDEFIIERQTGKLTIKRGDITLDIYILSDKELNFDKTDQFLVPPGDRYEGAKNDWHFKATTRDKSESVKFLALFIPYRSSDTTPSVTTVSGEKQTGFSLDDGTEIRAWWNEGETGLIDGTMARLILNGGNRDKALSIK